MKSATNGKGSKDRITTDKKEYDKNYDRIFKKCEVCKGQCDIGRLKGGYCQ